MLPNKSILIVVEGAETECNYFEHLKQELKMPLVEVDVTFDGKTDPRGIVQSAIDLRNKRIKESENSNFKIPYDKVWVVFDTEGITHHRRNQIANAKSGCNGQNIGVAMSDPCFEFWLLLHFAKYEMPLPDTKNVVSLLANHYGSKVKKKLDLSKLEPLVANGKIASKRAKEIRIRHIANDSLGNPSTSVDILFDELTGSK